MRTTKREFFSLLMVYRVLGLDVFLTDPRRTRRHWKASGAAGVEHRRNSLKQTCLLLVCARNSWNTHDLYCPYSIDKHFESLIAWLETWPPRCKDKTQIPIVKIPHLYKTEATTGTQSSSFSLIISQEYEVIES